MLDTTAMREILGFTPRYSTIEGFDDFVQQQGLRGPLSRDNVTAVERRLVDVLARGEKGHVDA